ncbi:MAG: hypothetical protein MUO61_05250 [Dehalococcoidia bacterium]|nr:hypothetical protein [Dehalococcoidia bacterium]
MTFCPESPVDPKKINEFYHYFATGRFAAADVYDGRNVDLNSGFLQARTVRRNAGHIMAFCSVVGEWLTAVDRELRLQNLFMPECPLQ